MIVSATQTDLERGAGTYSGVSHKGNLTCMEWAGAHTSYYPGQELRPSAQCRAFETVSFKIRLQSGHQFLTPIEKIT